VHPLNVQSVAWIAERKGVVSTFFWMLTLWTYARYVEHPGLGRYVLVLVSFALGLMSKQSVVTLPFALLLLDYWPLRRIWIEEREKGRRGEGEPEAGLPFSQSPYLPFFRLRRLGWLILEKLPLIALAAAAGGLVFMVQRSGGGHPSLEVVGMGARIKNALVSYATYLGQAVLPTNLAAYYPHPGDAIAFRQAAAAALLLLLITAAALWQARRRPYLAVGWLWYLGTLLPLIGLVQIGHNARADRYAYVPLVGIFLALAWGLAEIAQRRHAQRLVVAVAGLLFFSLMIGAWVQGYSWQNSTVLWEKTIEATTNNDVAYAGLGQAWMKDDPDKAIAYLEKSLALAPSDYRVHFNLARLLLQRGELSKAAAHFEQAIRLDSNETVAALAHVNLAEILAAGGKTEMARKHYAAALRIDPGNVQARCGMGLFLHRLGELAESQEILQKTVELNPDDPVAHLSLGTVQLDRGNVGEASQHFAVATRLAPDLATLHLRQLAQAYQTQGKVAEAAACLRLLSGQP
jgi:tetratricopeptide (TPR) repeat protein